MKKHTLKISTVSVLCVLCAVATDAFGAGSVRALGGTGTYNGTAAATSATTSSTAARATRAGSLRISPSTTRSVSTATRTTPSGATESTQRLSIGKYLGPATSVSTSGGSSSGGSTTPGATAAEIAEINNNITNIISNADRIEDKVDAIDNAKQDKLIADDEGIVEIENSTVSINMDNLAAALQSQGWAMGHKIELQYDGDAHLEWRYADTPSATWKKLMNLDELAGTYATATDLANAISGLASTYATKSEVNALSDIVAQKADSDSVYTKTATDALLEAKANTADVYTKSDIDTKLENVATDEVVAGKQPKSTADYTLGTATGGWNQLTEAQQSALNSGIDATKVGQIATNKADVASMYGALQVMDDKIALKANQNYVETELGTINNAISDIETIRSNATAGKTASDALGTGFDSTNTVASTIATLSDKVDDLPTDANLAEANEKITALETAVGDANSGLTKSVADNAAAIAANTAALADKPDSDDLADVAFSGEYTDLLNTPTIPDVSGFATTAAMNTALADKANASDLETLAGRVGTNETGISTNAGKITELQEVVTTNATNIANALADKQNSLNEGQLAAVNSGITGEKVSAYDAYANQIAGKVDATTLEQNYYSVAEADGKFATSQALNEGLALKANTTDLVQADWEEEDSAKLSFIQNKPTIPAGVIVDSELSLSSANAIQNKVVTGALEEKVIKGAVPPSGQYVLGFVNGVQAYIPIVDGNGDSDGPAIAAATGDTIE
ncbi:MAG: hypothetical protein IJ866_02710 [Alphaproteobacteria bacterium]|nr:hypothetical protein [Alphaproteobacteria bacterium]